MAMAFTIRELESLSGIKAHTIRIWEQRYGFLKPARTSTNIRTYSNEELKTLLTVSLLNRYGYKISRIDQMLPEQRASAALQLPHADARTEHLVNEMIGCMIDLKATEFERLLDAQIRDQGIEATLSGAVFYFLDKVGLLWQTSRIVPVQEHIVSNIIRQKILRAIDDLPQPQRLQPLFLLFLPEDEHHEMGLLFVYYLLRKKNIPVIYLGANVPLKDVSYVVSAKEPSALYLHLTSFPRQHSFLKFLNGLAALPAAPKTFISGSAVQGHRRGLPGNIQLLPSFSEVVSYISSLD